MNNSYYEAPSYSITYDTSDHATVGKGAPSSKKEGETVNFTINTDTDYIIKSVESEEVTIICTDGNYSFTMPAIAVTVKVTTEPLYAIDVLDSFYFNIFRRHNK